MEVSRLNGCRMEGSFCTCANEVVRLKVEITLSLSLPLPFPAPFTSGGSPVESDRRV